MDPKGLKGIRIGQTMKKRETRREAATSGTMSAIEWGEDRKRGERERSERFKASQTG
jgi:hypothetical protein